MVSEAIVIERSRHNWPCIWVDSKGTGRLFMCNVARKRAKTRETGGEPLLDLFRFLWAICCAISDGIRNLVKVARISNPINQSIDPEQLSVGVMRRIEIVVVAAIDNVGSPWEETRDVAGRSLLFYDSQRAEVVITTLTIDIVGIRKGNVYKRNYMGRSGTVGEPIERHRIVVVERTWERLWPIVGKNGAT